MHASPSTRRPRFGLDASAACVQMPPGVRRVAREVIQGLKRSRRVDAVVLTPPVGMGSVRWRQGELGRLCARQNLDGVVSFTSAFGVLGRGRRVQLVHELPWLHGEGENAGLSHRLWARHGWRRADRIVVPSEQVLADLCSFAPRAGRMARVIPWGLSSGFHAGAKGADEACRERLGLPPGDFLLMAGATRAKKRVDAALAGISLLSREGRAVPSLVVTGNFTEQTTRDLAHARELGLEGKLIFLGVVEEADLQALNRMARGALSLARSEGFGFGTLEAMASRTPVLVTESSAQADLAGDAGLRVNPDEPASIAAALEQINEQLDREQRVQRGQARAAMFTWQATIEHFETLLIELP